MLRHAFIARVYKALAQTAFFRPEDFEVGQESPNEQHAVLIVKYRFDPVFHFRASMEYDENDRLGFSVRYSPGSLLETEYETLGGTEELIKAITEWTQRLNGELQAIPIHRRVAEQQADIDEALATLGTLSDE